MTCLFWAEEGSENFGVKALRKMERERNERAMAPAAIRAFAGREARPLAVHVGGGIATREFE